MRKPVSRAGEKLRAALTEWRDLLPDLNGLVAADLGANVGGFTECLLSHGVARVYAIDTGYGVLAWELRNDPRVTTMERTNALHVRLPEPMDLVTIDVAWTRQKHIIPAALRLVRPTGWVVSLVKPHYEADEAILRGGILPPEALLSVLDRVRSDVAAAHGEVVAEMESPIRGSKGNIEHLWLVRLRGT